MFLVTLTHFDEVLPVTLTESRVLYPFIHGKTRKYPFIHHSDTRSPPLVDGECVHFLDFPCFSLILEKEQDFSKTGHNSFVKIDF